MTATGDSPARASLLMAGAGRRVAAILWVIATLWLAVGWAIGTPA